VLSPTGSAAVNVRWRLLVPAATAVATTAMLGTAFVAVRPGVTQMVLILLGGATATTAIGPAVAVVLDVVPLGVRATAVLIFALVQNLMGLAVGPVLTGALADKWGLTTALGFLAVFGLAAGLAFWWGLGTTARTGRASGSRLRRDRQPVHRDSLQSHQLHPEALEASDDPVQRNLVHELTPQLGSRTEDHRAERVQHGEDVRTDPSPHPEGVLVAHSASPIVVPWARTIVAGAGMSWDRPAGTILTGFRYSAEKFSPPVVTNIVPRPRLDPPVTARPPAPVSVVAAAAGWGKTIFAASWLEAGPVNRSRAWVSLDEADDDPHAFWCAVATAVLPVVDGQAAEALRRVAAGGAGADELPGGVAAALRLAPEPIALVLDNLHEISSPQVHAGLVRLVERPPANLSLLVTTRRDPPWPLPRLRLAGLVTEVRAADLAFRIDEAAQLFMQLGVGVNGSQVERLVARTEGWPAGLRLFAVHLKSVDEPEAAVSAFSGHDHSVSGYLLTEVLDRESPEVIAFLETISVVDLVCADLADALTGRHDGARVLGDLAASHLFVQAVGQPGRWYRLHRLISDILRARPGPRRVRRDLHRRAAQWFRSNGMPLAAFQSAVAGELWPLAADLAGTHALKLIMAGRGRSLERMLARIPRTVLGVHPELAGALAGARVALGSDAEVATLIGLGRAVNGAVSAGRTARANVLLDLSASGLARIAGDWEATVAAYRSVPVEPEALAALRMDGSEIVPVVVANNRGTAALWAGELELAEQHLSAAMEVNLDGLVLPQLNAASYHALLRSERGELDLAQAAARRVIDAASSAGLQLTVHTAGAYLTMASVALDRGGTQGADEWLERIADVEALGPEPHVQLAAAVLLATRREAAGDREAALAGLRMQRGLGDWRPPPGLRERWMLAESALLARAGDDAAARELLERMGPATTDEGVLAVARVSLLLGDLSTAVAIRAGAAPARHVRGQVSEAVLDTLLAAAAENEDRAIDRLEDALVAAVPWTLRRPFLAEAGLLQPLLERRIESGSAAPEFALDLMERMSHVSPAVAEARSALVDPLTGRERTVLRYLASTLSNAEIAAELYVSVSTIKTHQRALYRKLGAAGRREAVHRARLLHQL
jgi:LuxR family transcriptional regulator, maltose regulon positive regulatory protein